MTKAITYTYTIAHENCKQITLALLALCFAVTAGYAINLYRVVSHTVALKEVTAETVSVETAIQQLDAQYAALSQKITPETLAAYGFDTGSVKTFISRTSSLGRATLAAHEL